MDHERYKVGVGFTLLRTVEDLQGGEGQHSQPLASGCDGMWAGADSQSSAGDLQFFTENGA